MKDQRVEKLADILVDYSAKVGKGDTVEIKGSSEAEPLILAIYERCLARGAHPKIKVFMPHADPIFYRNANDEQLGYVWETDKWMAENLDVSFYIISEVNTRQLSNIDPSRPVITSQARKPLMDLSMQRAARGEFRWMVTLFPTEAHAMDAEMSLDEYEDFFYDACLVDADDPVAEWKKVAERHQRMIEWMEGRNEIHIEGEGTDLYLEVGGRIWLPADGGENFPDGEIFTGPIETATRADTSLTASRRSTAALRSRASGSSSMAARSSTQPPARTRTSSSRRSTPTRGPGSSARSASALTTASKSSPARSSSTRRSAARST